MWKSPAAPASNSPSCYPEPNSAPCTASSPERPSTSPCRCSHTGTPARATKSSRAIASIRTNCTPAFTLARTAVGNWILSIGGDANAAKNVGIPVGKVKIGLFVFMAFCATLFALLQVADAGSAAADRGLQKEFEAIIAAVIGGCLLTGGFGSVIGAALGAVIFGVVQIGIGYTSIDNNWYRVFLGGMLLAAVLFNNYVRRRVALGRA